MIIKLEITNFHYSFNAEHYYGSLKYENRKGELESIELKHPLTQKEATHLNKKDESRGYAFTSRHKKGQMSECFETEAQVRRAAIEWVKNKFPEAILIEGSYGSCSARPVIYWPESFEKEALQMNKLALEWDKIDGYEGNHKRAGKIDDEFNKLCQLKN